MDNQPRDLFARHCEWRPLDLTRGGGDHAAIHESAASGQHLEYLFCEQLPKNIQPRPLFFKLPKNLQSQTRSSRLGGLPFLAPKTYNSSTERSVRRHLLYGYLQEFRSLARRT